MTQFYLVYGTDPSSDSWEWHIIIQVNHTYEIDETVVRHLLSIGRGDLYTDVNAEPLEVSEGGILFSNVEGESDDSTTTDLGT